MEESFPASEDSSSGNYSPVSTKVRIIPRWLEFESVKTAVVVSGPPLIKLGGVVHGKPMESSDGRREA